MIQYAVIQITRGSKTGQTIHLVEKAVYLLLAAWLVCLGVADVNWLETMAREDGWVENLSALFWAAGLVSCLWYLFRGDKTHRAIMILFLVLCLLCLGEEISWAQRMLHLKTPDILLRWNLQKELNIHNLRIFHVSLISYFQTGQFRYQMILNPFFLLRSFLAMYFLALPVIGLSARGARFLSLVGYYKPRPYFIILFVFFTVATRLLAIPLERAHSAAETNEMCFAIFIAIYTWHVCRSSRPRRTKGVSGTATTTQ